VRRQRRPSGSIAIDNLDYTGRETGFINKLAQGDRAERCLL